MSELGDGGPAFPVSDEESRRKVAGVFGGMTLRDYFAARAMNGLLSYSYCNPSSGNFIENATIENVAERAYEYADAMLKARRA